MAHAMGYFLAPLFGALPNHGDVRFCRGVNCSILAVCKESDAGMMASMPNAASWDGKPSTGSIVMAPSGTENLDAVLRMADDASPESEYTSRLAMESHRPLTLAAFLRRRSKASAASSR